MPLLPPVTVLFVSLPMEDPPFAEPSNGELRAVSRHEFFES
jgi:hypothetical protein